jgi:transposase
LPSFERGQIVGERLAGASVIKTVTLLGVSKVTVSKVMSACTNHWKTTSAKRNSGQKSTLTKSDSRTLRRIVPKNHRTTAAQATAELSMHLEDPLSTKSVRRELHKSSIHGRAAIAKTLITESNTQMVSRP